MKVLFVIQTMNPTSGGPCEGIRNVVPELINHNVTHEVVCTDEPSENYIINSPFKIHAIGGKNKLGYYNKNLIPWLRKNIYNYNLVVIHALWGFHGYAVNKVLREHKNGNAISIPQYYVMPHGMLDPYFQRAKHRRLKAIRNIIYWELVERRVINQAKGLLFTCKVEKKSAREPFTRYFPKKELNIGYGIYAAPPFMPVFADAFAKKLQTSTITKPYFLFLSRINIKKGLDILVDAYLRILYTANISIDTIPDLVIAGPGIETHFGQKIIAFVQSNKLLNSKVHFVGMLEGDAKWGAFYGCEAFILPSHQENFGIVVAEALACKKAVLISDKVNIYEEIHCKNAGIVEPDTIDGTYNLLYKWLKLTKHEQTIICENALTCFQEHFTIQEAALQLKKVYDEVLN